MATVPFPDGRFFSLAWTIPEEFGGLTGAMLHRSRAFVRLGGVSVDVLTFDDRTDYRAVEDRLRARGEMIPGMRLMNLWDWLRDNPVTPAAVPLGSPRRPFTPLPPDEGDRRTGDALLRRTRLAADRSTVLQTDYYRADGSLLASERQDTHTMGVLGGRSVVLCGRDGQPVRSWNTRWALYRFWLDQLTKRRGTCFLIADSKPVSAFLHTYQRPRRVTVPVVHGSHLAGNIGPFGRLRPSRAEVLRHLDDYDAVVFLTERQRRDVRLTFGNHWNFCVIPHSRTLPPPADPERPANRGMLLGKLSRIKRPDHALRAVVRARETNPRITFDVYGDGPQRRALSRVISTSGSNDAIRLHGHRPDARERLAETSFLLLTSRSEGFALVLLEAMAAGCIPIAYDIRYGPADIIAHGQDGFLVPRGSIRGMTKAILQLQRLPDHRVDQMRRAARRTAERYSDEEVVPRWAEELALAQDRAKRRSSTK